MEIWLAPFAAMFTQPTWLNAVALATGTVLCLNRRTVCSALRAVDGASDKGFSRFHRFLSRGVWSGLQGSMILLGLLVKAFVADGQPLVVGVDDFIERRRGGKIRDKGIYRDPVRSSRGFFVKVEGLRWLSFQVLARPGFARRTWGLPFLTVLCPSKRANAKRKRRHQTLPEKGHWGHAADGPLGSRPAAGDGRGRRFRQPGGFPEVERPRGVRGALPDGRAVLQPAATTHERTERQVAYPWHPSADAKNAGGQESHEVGAHDRPGVADERWLDGSRRRCRDRNGAVELARDDRAGAMGSDQGPDRTG